MEEYEYVVIGCGATGFSVIKELVKRGKRVLAIDASNERVEVLRDENYDAIVGDATDENLYRDINFDCISAVMILTSDVDVNRRAVEIVRKYSKDVFVIVRSPSSKMEFSGADFVIVPSESMKSVILDVIKRSDTYRKLKKLRDVIESCKGKMGIFTHDNPDPDAISSAMALREIARSYGVESDILYYGDIMHQENRAMVNLLGVDMVKAEEVSLDDYEKFALVDCSKPGLNNSIPRDIHVSIVIDHHPSEDVSAEFVDLRDDVGACATILTEYLKLLKITPSRTLATALFFGIKTETNDFKKNTRTSDFLASAYLYPFVDHEMIEKMEGPAVSTETLDILATAIRNRKVYSSFLISFAGYITNRDALPQTADFLLRLEGISTVLIFGILKDKVFISARNKDVRINIGEVLKSAFGDVGSAGGHAHSGGAQIPLGIFGDVTDKDSLAKLVTEAIKRRFLSALGVEVKE